MLISHLLLFAYLKTKKLTMKIFSKISFICNVSFIIFIILGYIEIGNKKNKVSGSVMPLPFLTGTLVILGKFAIVINFLYCITVLVLILTRKVKQIPQWIVIANFIFLLMQIYYILF